MYNVWFFACLVAAVASSGATSRVPVRRRPAYTRQARESAVYNLPQQTSFLSQNAAAPAHSSDDTGYDLPGIKSAQSSEKFDNHESLSLSVGDIFGDAQLTPDEVVVLVGSGLASLMQASLSSTYGTGMQEFIDASRSIIGAGRKVLENRVANGIPVSEEQFEDLRKVEERMSAVLDAFAATFHENEHTVYSLSTLFEDFDFDPVERSKFLARVLPTISRAVFQVGDGTTAEKLRDAFNVVLPVTRKFIEERIEEGKPVTQEQIDILERAEELMPPLMQAFVIVVHDPLLADFMQKMDLDFAERAKYIVRAIFASLDVILKDLDASVSQKMRDVTLAFLPVSRQVLEDRLAQGKSVTKEDFDNLERVETTLPIILDAYFKIVDDLGIH